VVVGAGKPHRHSHPGLGCRGGTGFGGLPFVLAVSGTGGCALGSHCGGIAVANGVGSSLLAERNIPVSLNST
jgi:hypothetical protein